MDIFGIAAGDDYDAAQEMEDLPWLYDGVSDAPGALLPVDDSTGDEGGKLNNPAWYDDHGNLLPIDQHSPKLELEEPSFCFNPNAEQLPRVSIDRLVPIYDSSTSSRAGFSLVGTAQASSGATLTVGYNFVVGLEVPIAISIYSARAALRAIPTAAIAATTVVAIDNAAQFESQHILLNEDFNDWMMNPLISNAKKDQMMQQVQNDKLFKRASIVAQVQSGWSQSEIARLMGDIQLQGNRQSELFRMDIDPNANQPSIESFPVHYQPRPILVTTDDRDKLLEWSSLPGFTPAMVQTWQESFPDQSQLIDEMGMSILYKDYEIKQWNVKQPSVKDAPAVWQHGKFGKIYKDPEQTVGNKEIWWSKDTAQHGGVSEGLTPSTYKLFVEHKVEFEWIADVDATGSVIKGKNKSKIGDSIPFKQCWKVK